MRTNFEGEEYVLHNCSMSEYLPEKVYGDLCVVEIKGRELDAHLK